MKRIWLIQGFITGSLIAITLLALIAGRVLGTTPAALRAQADCQMPCWNYIYPGQTLLGEAVSILEMLGYRARRIDEDPGIAINRVYINDSGSPICRVGLTADRGSVVREVILRACDTLPLGDVFNLMGQPDSLLPIASLVIYWDGQMLLTLREATCDMHRIAPQATIRYISLADSTQNSIVAAQESALPWKGFIPFWHYGRLFPEQIVC
ncbi:MAG: hypothetical protein K8I30_12630 [Anaerolineae bacterium]|nr:hypothetical protein [Anaerolineae bacterium]